jgi:hypothetical protein
MQDLHGGRKPRSEAQRLTIHQLAVASLKHKGNLLGAGDLSRRMWEQHEETRDRILKPLGKQHLVSDLGPDDFAVLGRKRPGLQAALEEVTPPGEVSAESQSVHRGGTPPSARLLAISSLLLCPR